MERMTIYFSSDKDLASKLLDLRNQDVEIIDFVERTKDKLTILIKRVWKKI